MKPNRPLEYERALWWHTASTPPQGQPLDGRTRFDVAIIGAGFTGLTAAWHLARRGASVVVLEANKIGSGASGLNAGFVVPNFAKADPRVVIARLGEERGRRLLDLVGQGADRVFATARDNAIACDAEQVGWLQIAHSDTMLDLLKARVEAWQKLGRPLRLLSAHEARSLTGMRRCAGALLDPSGGMLHPLDYCFGLARLCQAAGVIIHEDVEVDSVTRQAAGWLLSSAGHEISADKVLLCTNATDYGVARQLFKAIVPLRVYQIATKPLPKELAAAIAPKRNPAADTRANLFTYRLDRDNRLISGGMAVVPIMAHQRMAAAIVARLKAELDLPIEPQVEFAWRGAAAITTDFLPHIYEFASGFIGGIGCNGRGIAMTSMLGEVLADAAMGAAPRELPIPMASTRAIPLHLLAQAAPSFAVAQAKWQDRAAA